ncbi:MAG: transposase, partial [Thermodesulfobacteriota bacterium]
WVLLPDHLHCLWTLPPGDSDFSTRWRLVKGFVSRALAPVTKAAATPSRLRTGEKSLWQRRFWEHTIRDDRDFAAHCEYIHYNPVKHGLCRSPADWPWSTLGRYVADGSYPAGWDEEREPSLPEEVGRE